MAITYTWPWAYGGDSIVRRNARAAAASQPETSVWYGDQPRKLAGERLYAIDVLELRRLAAWVAVMVDGHQGPNATPNDPPTGDFFAGLANVTEYLPAELSENANDLFLQVQGDYNAAAETLTVSGSAIGTIGSGRYFGLTERGEVLLMYNATDNGDNKDVAVVRAARQGASAGAIADGSLINALPASALGKVKDFDTGLLLNLIDGYSARRFDAARPHKFYDRMGWYITGENSICGAVAMFHENSGSVLVPDWRFPCAMTDGSVIRAAYWTPTEYAEDVTSVLNSTPTWADLGDYLTGEAAFGASGEKQLDDWHELQDEHVAGFDPEDAQVVVYAGTSARLDGTQRRYSVAGAINSGRAWLELCTQYGLFAITGYSDFAGVQMANVDVTQYTLPSALDNVYAPEAVGGRDYS